MDLVGKTLADRYEIIEEVGKGGMAHVYKAWCNLLNRFVAIKVLKEEFKDDKEFVRRFNVEAQAAAGISNPHVVSIYDVGYENGLYYIVMEYVEGITLKEYIADKGVLPWKEAVGYAAQICEGVDAAHKNRVIHRDIKPQNIIMTQDGILKVTDFGIARASGNQATMTMANTAIGTVHYLSPEQARGGYTDERTDIYSLGVVLYEMLTGRLPFTDDSPVAVAIKHIQESPTPLRAVNPDIPEVIEQITLKAMNKEQNVRYAGAADMLKDLRGALKNPDFKIGNDKFASRNTDEDDMETTIKMKSIDSEAIGEYENENGKNSGHVSETDKEAEERKLRELNEKRAKRERKRKERRVTIIAILAAVLVVAGLGFAFSAITGGFSFMKGEETIEIPDLIDMEIEKVQHQYKEQGFSIVKDKEVQSDKDAGVILEQSPEAGTKKNKNSNLIIKVTVSAGNEAVTLESYADKTGEEAQKALKNAGFQVNIIEDYSDSTEKGKVFAQEPAAGTAVNKGALITLRVSKGPQVAKESSAPTATASATKSPESEPTSTPKPSDEPKPSATSTKTPTQSKTPDSGSEATKTPGSAGASTGPGISN